MVAGAPHVRKLGTAKVRNAKLHLWWVRQLGGGFLRVAIEPTRDPHAAIVIEVGLEHYARLRTLIGRIDDVLLRS